MLNDCPNTFFIEIEVCRLANEEKKAAERRKKTVIVGDLHPLLLSLPNVEPMTNEEQQLSKGKEM